MALTDNTLTQDELTAAIDANPAIVETIKAGLAAKSFVLRTLQEETDFKTNLESSVASRKTSEFAQNIEKDVFDATGVAKLNADEKYFDYLKRAFADSTKSIKDELQTLKDKPGARTEADKKLIEELQAKLATNKTEYDNAIAENAKKLTDYRATALVDQEFAKLKFKATIPESVLLVLKENAKQQLLGQIKLGDDDAVTLVGKDGIALKNSTDYKDLTLTEAVTSHLKDAIEVGRKAEGAGGDGGGAGGAGGGATGVDAFKGVPADVKTKYDLGEHLQKIGIVASSPDYDKILSEHGKDLPLR